MSIKVAINGFGRIGRATFENILQNHPKLEVIAINDLTNAQTLAHLLKYDSIYGQLNEKVKFSEGQLIVGSKKIIVLAEKNPTKLPWKKLKVDVVLECTGIFRDLRGAQQHINAGAKKVIISAPSKGDGIPSFILGVNEEQYNSKKDHIVDMGSCTTNCLAPVAKVLNDNFGIISGFMTTVHSYTNDQKILDLPHKDLRRARAAAINIIPTTTGATKTIGKIIPELKGKLDGTALRVPTPIVSIIELVCRVRKDVTVDKVNKAFKKAEKTLNGILRVEENELVSTDFIGDSYSAIVDASSTQIVDDMVKMSAWYDNEWAYSARLAAFAEFIGKKL
ncbi:MAG: type I glyceraldehyde-3-phosphate dehydrogenase [Patescibacteria group bacterium]